MVFCCNYPPPIAESKDIIGDVSDIAQVVIALANILLAFYLLFYQKRKDSNEEKSTALLNEQNIKLQWFKELIIQPRLKHVDYFYDNLYGLQTQFGVAEITEDQRIAINTSAKDYLSIFRKNIIDVMYSIDPILADKIKTNVDELVDGITSVIFENNYRLHDPVIFERHIGSKVRQSHNQLIATIYNYKGIS